MILTIFLVALCVICFYQYLGAIFNFLIGGFDTKKEFLYWMIPVYPSLILIGGWLLCVALFPWAMWKSLK